MLSPAYAGDKTFLLVFLREVRKFISLFILLGSNSEIFLEYLDEIALGAEAEKIAYLRVGILREGKQICCLLSLGLADIIAERNTRFRLEKS